MGLFDMKKEAPVMPEVAACDRELAALGQQRTRVFQQIGEQYASMTTKGQAAGTPFEGSIVELEKIADREVLLGRRKLAVQGLRKCEHCGHILPLDSGFCNKCGGKLEPMEPEVLTDGPLCPQCKAPVEAGVAFCTKCGARLEAAEPVSAPVSTANVCPDCGAEYTPGTKFCVKCGKKLGE